MKRGLVSIGCLFACSAPEPSGSEGTTDSVRTSEASSDGRPRVRSPAEAVDEAPDDAEIVRVSLIAAPYGRGWAYNQQVPGPTLRLVVGQTLEVRFSNDLPDPTTIHWHGLHVPFEMDGATWMHDPIPPGGEFLYTFRVDQPGTFWYHPHFDTARQVDLGLYGAIVVEDPQEPPVDHELVAILDSWDEMADRDDHHGLDGVRPQLTVNGLVDPVWEIAPSPNGEGTTARIRWVNAANIAYAALESSRLRWIATDQGLSEAPRSGLELLSPGDRADADLALGAGFDVLAHPWSPYGGATLGTPIRLLSVQPERVEPEPQRPDWPFSYQPPTDDPTWTDLVYVLQGDPMARDWRINGERFPDVTPFSADLDQPQIVEVRNLSGSEHPFHVHGHAFEVLNIDGVSPTYRQMEDTINVAIHQTIRLRLIPDNPGHWMVHCHILPHADEGMMTVINIEGEHPHGSMSR